VHSSVPTSGLALDIGQASQTGPKPRNEDACLVIEPDASQSARKGCLLALADGVSQSADGGMAARSTTRALAADYYATPATWEIAHALERVIVAHNRWLHAQSSTGNPPLTTLTALVLRGRHFTMAHVGDCRLYRLRSDRLEQLSEDHIWQHPGYQHVLKRALGLEQHVVLDFRDGQLEADDVYALLTDGVWDALPLAKIHEILQLHSHADSRSASAARDLVQMAIDTGTQDNASALVVRIASVPPSDNLTDDLPSVSALAVLPVLQTGQTWDGYRIDRLLAKSRTSLVYLAHDAQAQGPSVVIKALSTLGADDEELARNLLIEAWLLRKANSRYLPEVVDTPIHQQWLALCTRWYPGATLADWVKDGKKPTVAETVRIALHLTKALGGLHRLDILHRDIKTDNIHIDTQGEVRLLDLGVAFCPGITDAAHQTSVPGTPSYLAPELFQGQPHSVRTDIYALGVSLYQALTGHYPYGEVEAFSRHHFSDPVLPTRYRPDLPAWLESVLLKAVARDPLQRFETCEEMHLALELADAKPIAVRRHSPFAERIPPVFWVVLALLSVLLNAALLIALAWKS
jgi:serine/threonine protein phosphatase PrpC